MARSSRPKGSGSRQGDRPTPTPSTPPANAELEAEIERAIGSVVGQSQRGQVARRVISLIRSEAFSGPLPPPQHLAEYEKICPGLADRIMKMAEVGQIRNEDRIDHVIDREYDDRRVGMYFGFAALCCSCDLRDDSLRQRSRSSRRLSLGRCRPGNDCQQFHTGPRRNAVATSKGRRRKKTTRQGLIIRRKPLRRGLCCSLAP